MIMNTMMKVSKKGTTNQAPSASRMSTERTDLLLKTHLETPRWVSVDRARLYTEAFTRYASDPLPIRRAKAYRHVLELVARHASLFHFDLKGSDAVKHRANTGVGNTLILANARRLSEGGYPVVFRIPLVPGYNDSPDDLLCLRDFLDAIGARSVDVLPYHNLGERKRDLTGMEDGRLSLASMSRADAAQKAHLLEGKGRVVTVIGESLMKPRIGAAR